MRTKYLDIVASIERRLSGGDYALNDIPGERRLATEFGVSHMTARKAVQHLVKTGVLKRPEKGIRTARPRKGKKSQLIIGLVMPAFESIGIQSWYRALGDIVQKAGGIVRPVPYVHDADPAIGDALCGDFTGLFLIPPHRPSELLLDQMRREKSRIVTLWHDHTPLGIPCVEVASPRFMGDVVEYLASLGHRGVDCINNEPMNTVVEQRIDAWRQALSRLGLTGELLNDPVQPFQSSPTHAYECAIKRFRSRRPRATAAVGTTTAVALGTARAAFEAGIQLGRDLSLTGWSDLAIARLFTPSITAVQPAEMEDYLNRGLEWIVSGGSLHLDNLHLEPATASIWIGESTGAPGKNAS